MKGKKSMEAIRDADCGSPAPRAELRPKVALYLKSRAGSGPTRWLLGYDEDPTDTHKAEVYLPKGSGPHYIEFNIVDPKPGEEFDLADPIWVAEGRTCPQSPSKSSQIHVLKNESTGTKLVVRDLNDKEPRILTYQLNFTGAGPCDPMIRNGGDV